ncbi:MAG: hypothetical protein WCP86_11760, partial [bacterium]
FMLSPRSIFLITEFAQDKVENWEKEVKTETHVLSGAFSKTFFCAGMPDGAGVYKTSNPSIRLRSGQAA